MVAENDFVLLCLTKRKNMRRQREEETYDPFGSFEQPPANTAAAAAAAAQSTGQEAGAIDWGQFPATQRINFVQRALHRRQVADQQEQQERLSEKEQRKAAVKKAKAQFVTLNEDEQNEWRKANRITLHFPKPTAGEWYDWMIMIIMMSR